MQYIFYCACCCCYWCCCCCCYWCCCCCCYWCCCFTSALRKWLHSTQKIRPLTPIMVKRPPMVANFPHSIYMYDCSLSWNEKKYFSLSLKDVENKSWRQSKEKPLYRHHHHNSKSKELLQPRAFFLLGQYAAATVTAAAVAVFLFIWVEIVSF